jgi:Mn2+/Fe2+ NRAMP family transporter
VGPQKTTDTPAPSPSDVHPGCLPPWAEGELPPPPPSDRRGALAALLAIVGPGLVMAGTSIGTGEWVMGPAAAALYMKGVGALLWVVVASIAAQMVLNTEVMRYTICTGEPAFTGFMRTRPGPRFWLIFYVLLDCLSWWPALGGLAAQILLVFLFGADDPRVKDPHYVRWTWTIILLACVGLLCFGGKVYNTIEWVLSGKVIFVLAFLVVVDLFFVPASTWAKIVGGFFNPFYIPRNIDWPLVTALAGFAGVGGMGNILASNFVREKGWGMGARVGAIPSIFGGHKITLSHLGTRCGDDPETQGRFRHWWRLTERDQYGTWAIASLVAMLLPCLLGAEFLKEDYFHAEKWRAAAVLAQNFGAATHLPVLTGLTLVCGLVILFPGQFGTMDGIARRWCDALWSGSRRARKMETHRIRWVYYSFIVAYTVFGLCVIWLRKDLSPPGMMVISANMANLAITATIFHTLAVNRLLLPPALRPSPLKQLSMVVSGLFFLVMFALVTYQVAPQIRQALGLAQGR